MLNFLIIIITLILIFYLLNKFIFKKEEHYLTYFIPYYQSDSLQLANFYTNNENKLNYFKKKFDYDKIKFGVVENDFNFSRALLSDFISKSNLYKGNIIFYKDRLHGIEDLINNQLNFNLNNYATIIYAADTLHLNIDNIRLVTTLYNMYIYIFTKKEYNIFTINDFPYNCKIGILNAPSVFILYYQKFLRDLGYQENSDYVIKIYDTLEDLENGLLNKECQLIILSDVFPNSQIKTFLESNAGNDIILLPFDTVQEKLFLKKNPQVFIDYVDLNYLSSSYLPKTFNKNEYNKNKPTIKLIYIHKILCTNIQTDKKYVYSMIKYFYENWKGLNQNIDEKGYRISGIGIDNKSIGYLDYHEGVLDYFKDIGLITNIDNNNCKYLIGKMACTTENLKKNNLLL